MRKKLQAKQIVSRQYEKYHLCDKNKIKGELKQILIVAK